MRMKRLLFLMLSLLAIGWGARAQEQELTVYEGQGTNRYVPAFIFYFDDFTRSQFVIPATDLADMAGNTITAMKFYTTASNVPYTTVSVADVYLMEVDYTSISAFEPKSAATIVYQGTLNIVASGSGGELTITFDTPFFYQGGNLLIGIENTTDSGYKSIDFLGQNVTGASVAGYNSGSLDAVTATQRNFIPQTTFYYTLGGEAPTCTKPKGLKLDETTTTTATVSWTAEEGTAYNLQYKAADSEDWTLVEGVTSPYTLTGLTNATTYDVQVQTACSATDVSAWTNSLTFTTECCEPEDMCSISYELTDSYGDGWNGNAIRIIDKETGALMATLTIASGNSATGTVSLCNGRTYQFWWTDGNYASECSYVFYDVNEDEIFSGSDRLTTYEYTMDCTMATCAKPKDLTVDEVTAFTATLSWTAGSEDQSAWDISYSTEADFDPESGTIVSAESIPFTLEGLTPETTYYAYVRAVCSPADHSKWSNMVSFTTIEACVTPTHVAATNVTNNSADITWQGDADTYELRYAEGTAPGRWLQYEYNDDGYTGTIGNSTANTWTWGVMYPGSMVIIDNLQKVKFYVGPNNTGDITINIYSGGDDAPGTLLHTQTVTPSEVGTWQEVTLSSPVSGIQGENLWITFTETGTYVMTYAQAGADPNGQWINNDGQWIHAIDASSDFANVSWMIRAYIGDDVDLDTYSWTNVTCSDNSYSIDGLDPETTYFVQVRTKCDEESHSKWAETEFTTTSNCAAPSALAASEVGSTDATLSWTGSQDIYNIMLTTVPQFDVSKFEQVGSDITTEGTLQEYTFDLSAYSGTGAIAIRHYNISDMFFLNIDDIIVKNAKGKYVLLEDFERGSIPGSWSNKDADGDGYGWNMRTNENDGAGNPVGNGTYCATSASYYGAALHPDNWLIIPNVELGGTLKLVARGQDPSYAAEVFGVFVCTDIEEPEVITINNVTDNPYTLEGLKPGTTYSATVQGVSDVCGTTEWSEPITFTTTTDLVLLDNDYDQPEGQKNTDLLAANMGKPVNFTISGRTLYKDGSWNTIILPFSMTKEQFDASPLAGADIQFVSTTSTVEGTHVTLEFGDFAPYLEGGYSFFAGYPFFVKWESGENIVDPTFTGVVIEESEDPFNQLNNDATIYSIGQYSSLMMYPPEELTGDDDALIYYLGSDNKLRYTGKQRLLNAFRHAFVFRATDGSALPAGELDFTLNFDDGTTTGIVEVDGTKTSMPEGYYNIQGMKLNNAPKQKGIYITNGKKFIVK